MNNKKQIKKKIIKWAEHVARTGKRIGAFGVCCGKEATWKTLMWMVGNTEMDL
jgi:dienelactone hydrolase